MKQTITNENGETIVRIDSLDREPLTAEEIDMINRMDDIVDEYYEDCPPMPEEMMIQMRNDIELRRRNRIARNTQAIPRPEVNTISAVG